MSAAELRIALLQLAGSGYDREASLEHGLAACRRAAAAGADVALFPELWSTGYAFSDGDLGRWRAQAIARDDPWVVAHADLAAELGMAIGATYLERSPAGPRNAAHAVRPARARGAQLRQGAHLQLRPAGAGAGAGGGVPGRPAGDARGPRRGRRHDLLRPRVPGGRARARAGRGRAAPRAQRLRARGEPARPGAGARVREHGRRGRGQLRGAAGERPLDGGRPDRLRRGGSQPRHARLRGRGGGGRLRRPPRPRRAARVAPPGGVGEPVPAAGDLRRAGRGRWRPAAPADGPR